MQREKQRESERETYKGTPIRVTADFSAETLQARREWRDILKVMKGKNLQPRLLYPARISFRFNGEIKSFTDKEFTLAGIAHTTHIKQQIGRASCRERVSSPV